MELLLDELRQRWTSMFSSLAGGDDVPLSLRLRAEGMMEAMAMSGQATIEELDRAMDECYRSAFQRAIAGDFGADWREFYPFPQIPAVGKRAPVFPSTRD